MQGSLARAVDVFHLSWRSSWGAGVGYESSSSCWLCSLAHIFLHRVFQSATKAHAAFEIALHECFRLIGLRGPLHNAWVKPCNMLATMVLAEWMVSYAEKMEGAVLHEHLWSGSIWNRSLRRWRFLLQPVSDVNPRQTMTRLAVHVAERCPKAWLHYGPIGCSLSSWFSQRLGLRKAPLLGWLQEKYTYNSITVRSTVL